MTVTSSTPKGFLENSVTVPDLFELGAVLSRPALGIWLPARTCRDMANFGGRKGLRNFHSGLETSVEKSVTLLAIIPHQNAEVDLLVSRSKDRVYLVHKKDQLIMNSE